MSLAARFCVGAALLMMAAPSSALHAQQAGTKPQYGTWGFDATGEDKSTKAGDDFFRFANGAWLDRTQIPPDKPGVSLRLEMTDRTEARLHEMMEQAAAKASHPADLEGKMGAFYKAFMDENRVEQLGAKA
jgi:putative endopeptidase